MRTLSRKTWLIIVVVAVLLVAAFAWGMSREAAGWDPEQRAVDLCTSQVESKLKAPSTAEFSNIRAMFDEQLELWTVSGSVDAENSFGAPMRMQFECPDFSESAIWIKGVTVK